MIEPSAPDPDVDPLAAVRQAAGNAVSALADLVEAARDVVDDPESFAAVIDRGRSTVENLFGTGATTSDTEEDVSDH
jgi:hypothetical protein